MPRARLALTVTAGVLAAPAAAAHAGTITLDRSCYVENGTMLVSGAGFRPGSQLTLSGDGASATAMADAAGNFQVPVQVPINPSVDARPSSVITYNLQALDYDDAAQTANASYQVTNYGFETTSGVRSPRTRRTWWFAGLPEGATVYGHFRWKGRTRGTYRFGNAAGPCGLLQVKAPGIPVRRLHTGTWTVQVDTTKRYNKRTPGALRATTPVYLLPR